MAVAPRGAACPLLNTRLRGQGSPRGSGGEKLEAGRIPGLQAGQSGEDSAGCRQGLPQACLDPADLASSLATGVPGAGDPLPGRPGRARVCQQPRPSRAGSSGTRPGGHLWDCWPRDTEESGSHTVQRAFGLAPKGRATHQRVNKQTNKTTKTTFHPIVSLVWEVPDC